MQCETVQPLLYRWVDERLLPDDSQQVQQHLESCAACARRAARIRRVDEALMVIEEELPPARLRRRILAAYRTRTPARAPATLRRRLSGRTLRDAAAIALVALGSSAATFWIGHRTDQTKLAVHDETRTRTSVRSAFPLVMRDTYTRVQPDGRVVHGAEVHFIR